MKTEKKERSRGREGSARYDEDNSTISPDGSPNRNHHNDEDHHHHDHYNRHFNHSGSDGATTNYSPRRPRGRAAAADNRRTQSERRASSRHGRLHGCRAMNPHVRAVRETATLLRREVKAFLRQYLGPGSKFDIPACTRCLEEDVLPGWGVSSDGVKDYEKFLKLTLRRETDEEIVDSDQYMDLISIAKRAREFEILLSGCQRRLHSCYDSHARPHLVSLKHMLPSTETPPPTSSHHDSSAKGDNVLNSVDQYEAAASHQAETVEHKLAELDNTYASYKETLRPFVEFVRSGDSHSSEMGRCCKSVLEVCKMLEAWAQGDHGYPESLVKELEEKKRLKESLQLTLRQTQLEKSEKSENINKLLRKEAKAARLYTQFKTIRERLKDRLAQLRDRDLILSEKLTTRREQLEAAREEREGRGDASPRRSQPSSSGEEKLEANIDNLERERRVTGKNIDRVEGDIKPTNDRAYENKVEMVTFRHQREETEKECRRLDGEIVSLRERIARLDELCERLVFIRELKISPEAYRKGLRQLRRQEALKADGSQDLTEACQQAAPALGKKWRKLYFYLPFDPPRDVDKRQRDVTLLDTIASRKDLTDNEVARKSLEKWRTFHRRGVVLDLSQALRAIHKSALATQIEKTFRAHALET
ncbi:hypothetical protein ElyMa_000508300 [Elysia marginata]|uniref:Death domain-containing protein n=1 Tax=Elysia marginata TaxID=1093978 RepID=A0AAV4FXH9_9GAST|nr:hypothetical protein ElyMa_000508300 [Elysia marginata]